MRHNYFPKLKRILCAFFCIFLNACVSAPGFSAAQAPTTLVLLRINLTPALSNYRQLLNQCALAQPDIALFVQEIPPSESSKKDSDLQLRLGLPDHGIDYAFQVGEEDIQFIVNSNQKAQSISTDQIRAIFTGEITDWSQTSGGKGSVHPWVYSDSSELESIFERTLMNGTHISPSASIATDPEIMRQAITQDDGAIGFLPSSWLTNTVQAVGLEQNLASKLKFPVLALAESEPQGWLGVFIACLQKNRNSAAKLP
jgi:hypothetical protein